MKACLSLLRHLAEPGSYSYSIDRYIYVEDPIRRFGEMMRRLFELIRDEIRRFANWELANPQSEVWSQ
jgi:hypothetical protein